MAGFGTEMLLFCALGFVVLGPRRMNVILQQIARAKAELDKTRREIKSQLTNDLDGEGRPPDNQG
jgi:Sec-independent protein translocase protein TatA